jgi:hypothetical protein
MPNTISSHPRTLSHLTYPCLFWPYERTLWTHLTPVWVPQLLSYLSPSAPSQRNRSHCTLLPADKGACDRPHDTNWIRRIFFAPLPDLRLDLPVLVVLEGAVLFLPRCLVTANNSTRPPLLLGIVFILSCLRDYLVVLFFPSVGPFLSMFVFACRLSTSLPSCAHGHYTSRRPLNPDSLPWTAQDQSSKDGPSPTGVGTCTVVFVTLATSNIIIVNTKR